MESGEMAQAPMPTSKPSFGERLARVPHNVWVAIVALIIVVTGLIVFVIFITAPREFSPDSGAKVAECTSEELYRITYAATTKNSGDGYFHIEVNAYLPDAEDPEVLIDGETSELISFVPAMIADEDESFVPGACVLPEEHEFTVYNAAIIAKEDLTCKETEITLKGEGYELSRDIDRQFCKTKKQVDEQKGKESDAAEEAENAAEVEALARNPWRNLSPRVESLAIDQDSLRGTLTVKSWPAVKGNGGTYPHPDASAGGRDFDATDKTSGYIPVLITITNTTALQRKVYPRVRMFSKDQGKKESKVSSVSQWCLSSYVVNSSYCTWSDPLGQGESVMVYGYVVISDFITSEYPNGAPASTVNGQVTVESYLYNNNAGGTMILNFVDVGGRIVLGT